MRSRELPDYRLLGTRLRLLLVLSRGAAMRGSGMTKDTVLAALDKPRSANALLMILNPGGRSTDTIQTLLMQMRDEGLLKFDIKKGLWSCA